MADPTRYEPGFSFSGFQASQPATPLPAQYVDDEFANISLSTDEIIDALADVRRSDGALKNDIVTEDSLSDEVLTLLAGDATVAVGTVTTLAPGASATVVNVGEPGAAIFDFGIPRGATGTSGAGTGDMVAATYDPTTKNADAFAMVNMVEGTTNKIFTATERTKLSGIASGATANDTDANLKDRANHTGTQLAATISNFSTAADARIAAAAGVSIQGYTAVLAATTASFTTTLKSKLDAIASGATANDTDANLKRESIIIPCSDESTAITAGAGKVKFRMPYAFTLTEIPRASLTTAQASSSIFTVDINEEGSSILSTKLTIDNTEKTSKTAATPAVLSDTTLADDAEISIDVDQVGAASVAAGLKVTLTGYRT